MILTLLSRLDWVPLTQPSLKVMFSVMGTSTEPLVGAWILKYGDVVLLRLL